MKLPLEGFARRIVLAAGLAISSQVSIAAHAEVVVVGPQATDVELCNNSMTDPDAAIPACTRLIEANRKGRAAPGYLSNRGVAKIATGDVDSAIEDFTSALDLKPNFLDGFRNRGLAYHMSGDYDRAIADFKLALKLDDKSAALYNARGTSLVGKEELGLAIADFDRALKLDPDYAQAYYNRGQAEFLAKDFTGAIADLDAYIARVPKEPRGYIQRGDARVNEGDIAAAIADFDVAIDLDPKNWEAYSHRGEARRLSGDLEASLADHDQAVALGAKAEAHVDRALARADLGRLEDAIADCSEAILVKPRYDLAYAARGRFRRLAGDLGASLSDLDKALALNPRSFRALSFRGETHLARGDAARAIDDFNESLAIAPDFVAAYAGRGQAYEMLGDITKAAADYVKARALPATADAALAKPAQELVRTRLAALGPGKGAAVIRAPADGNRRKREAEAAERKRRDEQLARAELDAPQQFAQPREELEGKKPAPQKILDAGRRVALVIGNSAYQSVANLANPQRDAGAVAEVLRKLGFETVIAANDLTREQFRAGLDTFETKVKSADWALVFFAGHGIEVGGKNYLIPVDAKLYKSSDVEWEAVNLDLVLQATQHARKLRLVLLDACRNNPFAKRMRVADATRSVGRGFARIEPATGTLVAYAAKDGEVAADGDDVHSPFTTAFLKYAVKPRLEINLLFRNIRDEVLKATDGAQEPFIYSSLPGEEFYLAIQEPTEPKAPK
jgi:tetratricopeptide (TPR) repeat protein